MIGAVLTNISLTPDMLFKHAPPLQPEYKSHENTLAAPDITESEIEAVTSVLRTSRLSLGPQWEELSTH